MKASLVKHTLVFGALVGLAVSTRLLSTIPNFHAVTAAALFAGFYLRSSAAAACVPLAAMVASDYFLGGYSTEVMLTVYASLLLPLAWKSVLRRNVTPWRLAAASLCSTLLFFLATNAAVWHAWYPHSWAALARCYTVALPFLANAVCGDLVFTGAIFGAYALTRSVSRVDSRKLAPCAA